MRGVVHVRGVVMETCKGCMWLCIHMRGAHAVEPAKLGNVGPRPYRKIGGAFSSLLALMFAATWIPLVQRFHCGLRLLIALEIYLVNRQKK